MIQLTITRFISMAAVFILAGCASNSTISHIPANTKEMPMKLAVFLDGTANNEGSHTNIAKLHNLTTLQNKANISTAYIEGVGTNGKFVGMAMGWGIGHDVREAYLYIAENYKLNRKDEIYIFGFSRGAYAARILSALIHVAGIPDISNVPIKERPNYINRIYAAFKSEKSIAERRKDVMAITGYMPTSVDIEFLGLWDTVEALGWPDYKEDFVQPNQRYADQLCNIKKAAHALALDDDRARIFTPILLTRNHLIAQCNKNININNVVDEVWFSGAHADVGGGYENGHISGVSLNWMLSKLKPYGLVPTGANIYADFSGTTHDPESGFFGLIYHQQNRNVAAYSDGADYNNGRLKIHQSVLDRLASVPVKPFESHWFESSKFKHCFQQNGAGWVYLSNENCFDVIGYN